MMAVASALEVLQLQLLTVFEHGKCSNSVDSLVVRIMNWFIIVINYLDSFMKISTNSI